MSAPGEEFELSRLSLDVWTLRCCASGETFHPAIGPMAEAEILHVKQQRLAERNLSGDAPLIIWDVGLGAAGNAIAVLDCLCGPQGSRGRIRAELHSFDRTLGPLIFALKHVEQLDYLKRYTSQLETLRTEGRVELANVVWIFHPGDFRATLETATLPAPHAILFDPYSPRTNPEMWSLDLFRQLRARLPDKAAALLTTYSRSTAVRVTLLLAGFFVGHGYRVGAKDETTIASNQIESLDTPLDDRWLARVSVSTAAAVLRSDALPRQRITSEEFARLREHPQFTR